MVFDLLSINKIKIPQKKKLQFQKANLNLKNQHNSFQFIHI